MKGTIVCLLEIVDERYVELGAFLEKSYKSILKRVNAENYVPYEKLNFDAVTFPPAETSKYSPKNLFKYLIGREKEPDLKAPNILLANNVYLSRRSDVLFEKAVLALVNCLMFWNLPPQFVADFITLINQSFDLQAHYNELIKVLHFEKEHPDDEVQYVIKRSVKTIVENISFSFNDASLNEKQQFGLLLLLLWTDPNDSTS